MANLKLKIGVILFTFLYFFSNTVAPVFAAITYLYDQNGNMTSDGAKCYEYNEANQVKKVKNCSNNQTIAEYVYDYQGNRLVKKTYASGVLQKTTFSPNDGYETVKLASNSAIQNTSYYFANDQLIAKKNPDGSRNYYHNDHLGSTNVMTNQSGGLFEETKYDPWGEVKTGGTKSKFLFTGQEKDLETSLNYYNARYYDSHIRRFTQPDDIIQNPFNPQSLNRYSYVLNNPLRYTDPTGHYAETAFDVAFIGMDLNSIRNDPTNLWNWAALGGDVIGAAVPLGTGFGLGIKTIEHGGNVKQAITSYGKTTQQSKNLQTALEQFTPKSSITTKYSRPSGGTTQAQRAYVQGKSCVDCGKKADKMVADHKVPLVKEYYKTGSIDINKMKSTSAVQPQCVNCSQKQGGILSNFSKVIKKVLNLK